LDVDFAAIVRIVIAVRETIQARTDGASASCASRDVIICGTDMPARAAVVYVINQQSFTAVIGNAVAVPEARLAPSNGATAASATRETIRYVTDITAVAAIVDVVRHVGLATIIGIMVAVREARLA
jgi:hypothetical protein